MRLEIAPNDGLADEVLSIRVLAAPADAEVLLTASVTDAKGHRWQSQVVFRTDATGVVDVARDAPLSGSYAGVDPTGLIWSMRFAQEDVAPRMFTAPADELAFTFTAQLGGGATGADGTKAAAVALRHWSAAGVRRSEIHGPGFIGFLFEPSGAGAHPAVAIIPGTTGANEMEPTAALLASHGYVAMVVGYMGLDGLPASLCEIPLETLAAGVRWLATLPHVDPNRVASLGASVGAEGMLAALAGIPGLDVRAVVAIAPSSVVWQAIGEGRPPQKSSWTLDGHPLPYLPIHGERLLPELIKNALLQGLSRHPRPSALHLFEAYAVALHDQIAAEQAAIRADQIDAPILFITGDDDQMWPAGTMVEALRQRRRDSAHEQDDRHLHFKDAGHIIRPPVIPTTIPWTERLYSGGTPEGSARAQAAAWQEILQFLREHLAG